MIKLTLTEKGGEPKVLTFDKDEITIGRVSGNDIVLAKGNVSKRHSRLTMRDSQMEISDLKSTNGTYVNGRKIAGPTAGRPERSHLCGRFSDRHRRAGRRGRRIAQPRERMARPRRPRQRRAPHAGPAAAAAARARRIRALRSCLDDDETSSSGEDEEDLGLAARPPRAGARPPPPPPPPPPARRPPTPLASRSLGSR